MAQNGAFDDLVSSSGGASKADSFSDLIPLARAGLSARDIAAYARRAGFSGSALRTAVAVAMAESGGKPAVIGDRNLKVQGEQSVGLWQINYRPQRDSKNPVRDPEGNKDPATNARNAYTISGGGKDFRPWTTFNTGAYKAYLRQAEQAALESEQGDSSQGDSFGDLAPRELRQPLRKPGKREVTPKVSPTISFGGAKAMIARQEDDANLSFGGAKARVAQEESARAKRPFKKFDAILPAEGMDIPGQAAKRAEAEREGRLPFTPEALDYAYRNGLSRVVQESHMEGGKRIIDTHMDIGKALKFYRNIMGRDFKPSGDMTDTTMASATNFGERPASGRKQPSTITHPEKHTLDDVPVLLAPATALTRLLAQEMGVGAQDASELQAHPLADLGLGAGLAMVGGGPAVAVQFGQSMIQQFSAATEKYGFVKGTGVATADFLRTMDAAGIYEMITGEAQPSLDERVTRATFLFLAGLGGKHVLDKKLGPGWSSKSKTALAQDIATLHNVSLLDARNMIAAAERSSKAYIAEQKQAGSRGFFEAIRPGSGERQAAGRAAVELFDEATRTERPGAGPIRRNTRPLDSPQERPDLPLLAPDGSPVGAKSEASTPKLELLGPDGEPVKAGAEAVTPKPGPIETIEPKLMKPSTRQAKQEAEMQSRADTLRKEAEEHQAGVTYVVPSVTSSAEAKMAGLVSGGGNYWYLPEKLHKTPLKTLLGEAHPESPAYKQRTELHRAAVEKAIADGETLPPEVLADYPDLARKPPATDAPKTALGATQSEGSAKATIEPETAAPPVAPTETPKPEPIATPEGTALQNKVLESARKLTGLDELDAPTRKTLEQSSKGAVEKGYHKPERAVAMADEVISGARKHLDDEQTTGMAAALDDLLDQHEKLADEYLKTAEKGGDMEMAAQLGGIRDQIGKLTEAGNLAGTEWGRAGVARQAIMKADGSYAGIVARRQRLVDRTLTSDELKAAKAEADQLKAAIEAKDNRIAALEAERANQTTVQVLLKSRKQPADKIARIDARIKDAGERLKVKWSEAAPKASVKASFFGVDIAAEQAARLIHVTPEIFELAKLHAAKGAITLAENAKAVVAHLKTLGVEGIGENDVAAVLAGKTKQLATDAEKTMTAYESVKAEARQAFRDVAENAQRQAREIAQQEREAKSAKTRADIDAARKARADWEASEKSRKRAESEFWKGVGEEEAAWQKGERSKKALDRAEYVQWWKGSIGGQIASALNRIEGLQEKLATFAAEGILPGKKSRLPVPKDAELQRLRIEEAALRNRMDKADREMAARAQLDSMDPVGRAFAKWNPMYVTRAIVASFDNSFPLNQGGMSLWSDPVQWSKGLKASFQGFVKAGAERVDAEMRAHENFDKAQAANLFESGADVSDIFGGPVNLPGIAQSQRAYETAARAMRFELFNRWTKLAELASNKPLVLEDYKAIAREVKTWTGQGVWGSGAKAQHLSKPFFALRYRLSQFETAFGMPLTRLYSHAKQTGNYGPFKMMLGRYAQAYGTMAATVTAASLALNEFGPKDASGKPLWFIELDPTSTNFGRLVHREGDSVHTFDVLPPAMRVYGLVTRVIAGKKITMGGTVQDATEFKNKSLRSEIVEDWISSGLHPLLNQAWSAVKAQSSPEKKRFGRSYDLGTAAGWMTIGEGFLPIPVQNLIELWGNDDLTPTEKMLATGLLPMVAQNTKETTKPPKDGKLRKPSFRLPKLKL